MNKMWDVGTPFYDAEFHFPEIVFFHATHHKTHFFFFPFLRGGFKPFFSTRRYANRAVFSPTPYTHPVCATSRREGADNEYLNIQIFGYSHSWILIKSCS